MHTGRRGGGSWTTMAGPHHVASGAGSAADREEKAVGQQFGTLSLEHSSTVDRVAQELRRAMFDGGSAAGTALREVALADSLGVSRPTVREALSALVAEGLVVRGPTRASPSPPPTPPRSADVSAPGRCSRGRAYAAGPTPQDLRDRVRTTLARYTTAVHSAAGYQGSTATPRLHVSLVALTGSSGSSTWPTPSWSSSGRARQVTGSVATPTTGPTPTPTWSGCSSAGRRRRLGPPRPAPRRRRDLDPRGARPRPTPRLTGSTRHLVTSLLTDAVGS